MPFTQSGHGLEQGERVEPVVDATAPDDHLVVRADARDRAADGVTLLHRCLVGDTERDHCEQRREAMVLVVHGRIHPALTGKLAEPEIALLVGSTQHEVRPRDLLVQHPSRLSDGHRAPFGSEIPALFELLQVHRVVNVGDEDLRIGMQLGRELKQEPLEDDDVRPLGGSDQRRPGLAGGPEALSLPADAHRGDKPDVMLRRERLGDLPRPDRGTRHPVEQRLAGDDQHTMLRHEVLRDPEGVYQLIVCRQVRGHPVGWLKRVPEQRE